MEEVKVVPISDLLECRRPISGAFSLRSSSTWTPATSAYSKSFNPNPSTELKFLKSLPDPSIIIGTLNLPTYDDSSSSNSTSFAHHCFTFSDGSASVCCDVLDFDIRMLRNEIHVLSWNFIPLKHGSGFLEIIRWRIPGKAASFLSRCSSGATAVEEAIPLGLGLVKNAGEEDSRKARYCITGVLDSISPVSVVPCTTGAGYGNQGTTDLEINKVSRINMRGFIVQIMACECKFCRSSNFSSWGELTMGQCSDKHNFCNSVFVYFSGSVSSWHPAVCKLNGKIISIGRLKKKLVYIEKDESQLMFVATDRSFLSSRKLYGGELLSSCRNSFIQGKGECGVYSGIVKGVYMQGMVVELDEEVWLLMTDPLFIPPHGIRIGAVISVRNVHFINPRFPWSKMLILGACYKTSVAVVFFSPMETGCVSVSQSQSLLRNHIQSLEFSSRLWVLLQVQCFRKKFDGIFSEKEILGSKHREGLAQRYTSSMLHTSVLKSQHGVFMEFCKHGSCGSNRQMNGSSLTLVAPFFNFSNNCRMLWKKSLFLMKNGLEIAEDNGPVSHLSGERKSFSPSMRRIFLSKDIGVSLLGNLKVSPSTGRLQLTDATGCIDVVIPDIPSSWNFNDIFEVTEYTLVLEGVPEQTGQMWRPDSDSLSCKSIFRGIPSVIDNKLAIYVFFIWKNATCFLSGGHSMELEHGTYHLLHLTHKFPIQCKIKEKTTIAKRSNMFAEALVLPWDLCYQAGNNESLSTTECNLRNSPCKRLKTNGKSQSSLTSGLPSSLGGCNGDSGDLSMIPHKAHREKFILAKSVEVPCLVSVRNALAQTIVGTGILFPNEAKANGNMDLLTGTRKVLLEFFAEDLLKYKLLRVGAYYIAKHCMSESFCSPKDKYARNVLIKPDMQLWTLGFHDEPVDYICMRDNVSVSDHENELVFQSCTGNYPGKFSDVHLHFSVDCFQQWKTDLRAVNADGVEQSLTARLIADFSLPVGCDNSSYTDGTVTSSQRNVENIASSLPQGNLVSLSGTVLDFCCPDCYSVNTVPSSASAVGVHQPTFLQQQNEYVCFHIVTDKHNVKIEGALHKENYPIGLGPGANVTLHRVLASRGQDRLMLTPVSLITVNSVNASNGLCRDLSSRPCPGLDSPVPAPEVSDLLCYFADLSEGMECKPRRFLCRVVAIYIVSLTRNNKLDGLLSKIHSRALAFGIPLAGFILDDGSSLCCCWANGEKAATVLRLHEEMPETLFKGSWRGLGRVGKKLARYTPSFYLDKILQQHSRVTVKNYGSVFDSESQDLQVYSGSDKIISVSDESLIKYTLLNACSGSLWGITGHALDSNGVSELEKILREEQMTMHHMPNIWAGEVSHVNPLAEAKAMLQGF